MIRIHSIELVPVLQAKEPVKLCEGRNVITPNLIIDPQEQVFLGDEMSPLCYINVDDTNHYELHPFGNQDIEVNRQYLTQHKAVVLNENDEVAFLLPYSKRLANTGPEVCWHRYVLTRHGSPVPSKRVWKDQDQDSHCSYTAKRYKLECEASTDWGEDSSSSSGNWPDVPLRSPVGGHYC